MGPIVVVAVIPFWELGVEDLGVVDDGPVQEPVELLGVDPVRPLHLAVETWGTRFDVAVPDPLVEHVEVEQGAEFGSVICLDDLDHEGESLEHVVDELDGRLLVEGPVDTQHAEPGAVVDGGELEVLLVGRSLDGLDELHVDLDLVARELLLVTLPTLLEALVALSSDQGLTDTDSLGSCSIA